MAELAKVTSKGQVTIPKRIRDRLKIREQDHLLFAVEGDHLVATPVRHRPLSELYGALPATRPYPGHDKVREEVRKELADRVHKGEE